MTPQDESPEVHPGVFVIDGGVKFYFSLCAKEVSMMGTENFVENVQRETKDRLSDDERWEIFCRVLMDFRRIFRRGSSGITAG